MNNGCQMFPGAEFFVAVDNKGLWPNLKILPNGELGAVIYNHPSHGIGSDSDIELWVSADQGRTWLLRSKISDHPEDPRGIRMNQAFGINAVGELIVLVSGFHEGQKRPFLPVQCCVSSDNGLTWTRYNAENIDAENIDAENICMPFGDIFSADDGLLACPAYSTDFAGDGKVITQKSLLFFSRDQGRTWGDPKLIAKGINETHVICLNNGDWLATGRTQCTNRMDGMLPHGNGQVLYRSLDQGRSWQEPRQIAPQGQENAHLLELTDGRIICAFTSRIPGLFGVVMRMSDDHGETWSVSVPLITIPATDWHKTDCGYPSSVQLGDGTIVTGYYFGPKRPEFAAHTTPWHQRYHMGIARWEISDWPLTE